MGKPPAPDVLGALGNLLPALDKVGERDAPALLLEPVALLDLHPHPDHDPDRPKPTQRTQEQLVVALAAHAHDRRVRRRQHDIEPAHERRQVSKLDSGPVRRGRERAGERLVRDGPERREREPARGERRVERGELDPALHVRDFYRGVDLWGWGRGCASVSQVDQVGRGRVEPRRRKKRAKGGRTGWFGAL